MRDQGYKRTLGTFVFTAVAALVTTVLGATPAVAHPKHHSDAVRVWNLHASDALINAPTAATPGAGQPPPVSQLHLAMVQGAVYDAVNAIVGGYQPYLPDLPQHHGRRHRTPPSPQQRTTCSLLGNRACTAAARWS